MIQPVFLPTIFVRAGPISRWRSIIAVGGDSGGERGRLAPLEQVEDCRNGFSWLEAQPFVDSDRLAQFGASFGGADYALHDGAGLARESRCCHWWRCHRL